MTSFRRRWMSTLFALVLCTMASWAQAATLQEQLNGISANIAKAIKGQGFGSVTVQVVGPATFPSSGPAMCKEVLCTALQGHGVEIAKLRADVGLSCELRVEEVKEGPDVVALTLHFTINFVDRNSKPVLSLTAPKVEIAQREEVCQVLGIPFDGSGHKPDGGKPNIVDSYLQPKPEIQQGTVIRGAAGGEFGIEILVGGRGKPVTNVEGLAFVDLKEHEECEVRLINDSSFEVGVDLTLDGLSCFWFHPSRGGLWIIGPHQTLVVKGWQLDAKVARTFRIVPFEKSVAASAGATGNVGVIAASFFRSYQPHEAIPNEDIAPPRKSLGIGAGDIVGNPVQTVERKFGKLRATVPVRYEKPGGY